MLGIRQFLGRMTERRRNRAAGVEQRALARFRALLKDKGLNSSSVRDAIALAAFSMPGHFDVNELVQTLHDAGVKGAHRTTVYRNLPLLIEAGIIQPTLVSAGDRHLYEAAFEREHHDHLLCTSCGRVVEFLFEAFEVLQRDLAARHGFELTGHVHELFGRCEPCRKADARAVATPTHRGSPNAGEATARAVRLK